MPRQIIFLTALFGSASAARVAKRRRHTAATSHIGSVPVFNEGAASERYNVHFGPKATDKMLEDFCAGNCEFMGHPDAGGVAFVVMTNGDVMANTVFANQDVVQAVENDGEFYDYEIIEDKGDICLLGSAEGGRWCARADRSRREHLRS